MADPQQAWTNDILKRSKEDPATLRYTQLVQKLASRQEKQNAIDLFKLPEPLAKQLLAAINCTDELWRETIGLLNYILLLKKANREQDKCLGELYDQACRQEKEIHRLSGPDLKKENDELRERNKYLEQAYIEKDESADYFIALATEYMGRYMEATGQRVATDEEINELLKKPI